MKKKGEKQIGFFFFHSFLFIQVACNVRCDQERRVNARSSCSGSALGLCALSFMFNLLRRKAPQSVVIVFLILIGLNYFDFPTVHRSTAIVDGRKWHPRGAPIEAEGQQEELFPDHHAVVSSNNDFPKRGRTEEQAPNDGPSHVGEGEGESNVLWVDHFSEQMGRAAKNFADLLTLTRIMNRQMVEPYVHKSRMTGRPSERMGTQPFSLYYDVNHINRLLESRGYARLMTTTELSNVCGYGWDVVVLFLYPDTMYNMMKRNGRLKWHHKELLGCRDSALKDPDAFVECDALQYIIRGFPPGMGFEHPAKVRRGVVVDLKRMRNPVKLERSVLKGVKCAHLIVWAGQGRARADFDLSLMRTVIRPHELKHSEVLLGKAEEFIRSTLRRPYIGIHIRAEKERKFGVTLEKLNECITNVGESVDKMKKWISRNTSGNVKPGRINVFYTTDLFPHGSDTMARNMDSGSRASLLKFVRRTLSDAFEISDLGLGDSGAQAIVEMHLVAEAKAVIVMGGGNFQEWIVSLHNEKYGEDAKVKRICSHVREGWTQETKKGKNQLNTLS